MRPFSRGNPPALLKKHETDIAKRYGIKRASNASYVFKWPTREKQPLLPIIRDALLQLTDKRCSYCDGDHLDATGKAHIDHFCPKGLSQFYNLVADWSNLYISCTACNVAKGNRWDPDLLRPDQAGYSFDKYFEYHFETGEIHENPAANQADKNRAITTINIFDLNRTGACEVRKIVVKLLRHNQPEILEEDIGYRYLYALCKP